MTVHAAAIFTTLHKVYVRLSLFTEAGKVLQTAQHKGLLDISDTDKSKPFAIRILDNSTLSASAQPVASLIPETVAMIFGTIRMHP
jgi:formate hydrogenlyase subunit 3/multisubunit Na+/H+ antiporter MnhD subunit